MLQAAMLHDCEFRPVVPTPGSLSGTDGSLSSIVKLSADGKVVYAIHN